jgi:hypothetical protein
MLGEARVIGGIGVRTAHSTPFTFTKRPLENLLLISVNSAKQKKKTWIAKRKQLNRVVFKKLAQKLKQLSTSKP